jgi:outer membrane protein assembly factor BamB
MPGHHRPPLLVGALVALGLAAASVLVFGLFGNGGGSEATGATTTTTLTSLGTTAPPETSTTPTTATTTTEGSTTSTTEATTSTATTSTTEAGPPLHEWVDRRSVGLPWGDTVAGLLTFRGNPTNTWYGTGPIPATPDIKWKYPDTPMCSQSTDLGVTSTWCGNGWTGQPVIWENPEGITEMIFGAYDRRLHFVDTATGKATRSPFATGDIIKGTPTIDPDGYPLVYFGSRDNELRILALDRGEAVELWNTVADLSTEGRWNDDWDASPRIVNDVLFEGSENSLFYVWKLNRGYDSDGRVTVDPEPLFKMETWNNAIIEAIAPTGYMATSVENTAAFFEGRVYFATSAGRVLGLDITDIEAGRAPVVFDYWVGDDVDASIVIDEEGMLYVAAEYERYLERAREVGQLVKLNPYDADDPYVWGMYSLTEAPAKGGLWSTPALGDGVVFAVTNKGFLVVVDRLTGEELWVDEVGPGSWSSPVVIEDRLLVATAPGFLRSYDITDPEEPVLEWEFKVGEGNIEATPAVWEGTIYVGVRDGYMYAIGE